MWQAEQDPMVEKATRPAYFVASAPVMSCRDPPIPAWEDTGSTMHIKATDKQSIINFFIAA
jgi:hypothetical protein